MLSIQQRVAGLRPSQHTEEQSVSLQVDALRAWAERASAHLELFVDEGWSGAKDKRPALDDMLGRMRRREFGALVDGSSGRLWCGVWTDSRGRSRTLAKLGEECAALGVELVSLTEGIDTTTATGRAMYGMCSVFAQLERDMIVERTRAGLQAARRRGVQLGRPRVVDKEMRARIERLRRCGRSYSEIAEATGISRASVIRTTATAKVA